MLDARISLLDRVVFKHVTSTNKSTVTKCKALHKISVVRTGSNLFTISRTPNLYIDRSGSGSWPNLGPDHEFGSKRFGFELKFRTGLRQH